MPVIVVNTFADQSIKYKEQKRDIPPDITNRVDFYLSITNTPQSCKKQYLAEERTKWSHLKTDKNTT